MKRIERTELIVLKTEKSGENHRLVTMLTERRGLIRALAFGASSQKSKLRAATNPFCLADGELYHDPVKDLWRITQLDGKNLFDGIREDLKKFYTVSLMVEIIIKTYGGGDSRIYKLFSKALGIIDKISSDIDVEKMLVLYLWRYLWMNGVLPDLAECSNCGKEIRRGESLFYLREGQLVCSNCRSNSVLTIGEGSLNYISVTSTMTFDQALMVPVDNYSLGDLKKCLIMLVQTLVEYPLKTLKSGKNII